MPFLTDQGLNYLLKMRDDTLEFKTLNCSKFFNFSEKNCDPFLINTSILPKKNLAVGGGIRAMKNQREAGDSDKIIIPLDDQTIQKAKAC